MRDAYKEINLDNIYHNVKVIIDNYKGYEYYFAMVKSNAYGHGYGIINTLIKAGINYIAVSNLDEALLVRKENKNIPILITEIINPNKIKIASQNNITITIDNIEYLEKIKDKITVHIKLDTGMNRLGVNNKKDFNNIYNYIKNSKIITLEGIFTHFATPGVIDPYYKAQVEKFKEITSDIDLKEIKIVHLSSSFMVVAHPKLEFENACRLGTLIYGYDLSLEDYTNSIRDIIKKQRDVYLTSRYNLTDIIRGNRLNLLPAFSIKTEIIEIKDVIKGSILGYNHKVNKDIKIGIIPMGYDDGIKKGSVLINDKLYKILDVNMCMSFISIDSNVKLGDEVTILGKGISLGYVSTQNEVNIQYTLINMGKTLPIKYIKESR